MIVGTGWIRMVPPHSEILSPAEASCGEQVAPIPSGLQNDTRASCHAGGSTFASLSINSATEASQGIGLE